MEAMHIDDQPAQRRILWEAIECDPGGFWARDLIITNLKYNLECVVDCILPQLFDLILVTKYMEVNTPVQVDLPLPCP
jgi:hypothetical protein